MASQLTIPQHIQIGDVSGPLAALYVDKKSLFGSSVIKPKPPLQITIITDILRWGYDGGAETDTTLRNIANYGYWMWGMFQLQAQNIISGPGGGSVVPTPSGGAFPNDLDFEVTASSFIAAGATSKTISQFIGYNVNFSRNGIIQNTTNLGDGTSYYAWNRVTGLFSVFPAVQSGNPGDLLRIMPDATGGVSTAASPNTPDTIILSATGTYTLAQGNLIWRISILPSAADTVRIGTTLNGEEIMMDKVMTPGTYENNGVTADVYASSGDVTIYFTGFTAAATINIYLLPI